uniref:CSON000804 protein n=1 Tax=Culicoides sonorensis TaxID=179676 RepID=A0A336MJP8_CULSO
MDFGYLPKSNIETGNLRTEEQLRSAIKNLQKFGGILETGVLDATTRNLIRQPRCGMPDTVENGDFSATNFRKRRRSKRYVIQGSKWDHTDITWR